MTHSGYNFKGSAGTEYYKEVSKKDLYVFHNHLAKGSMQVDKCALLHEGLLYEHYEVCVALLKTCIHSVTHLLTHLTIEIYIKYFHSSYLLLLLLLLFFIVTLVIFIDVFTLYMSMKITVLTPGTKTFNTNLVFFF